MKRKDIILTTAFVLGATALVSQLDVVKAHSGASGVVKHRMELMKSLGKSMKSLAAMFKGKTVYDPATVHKIAVRVQEHADKIPTMFPKGSNKHPSEAKATIWMNWSGFEESAGNLRSYAVALEQGSKDQIASRKTFKELAKSCKGCHQDFREKKK